MTYISIRDLRTRPGEVWELLQNDGDLILTSRGRPFALMIAAEGDDVEELLMALRRARAMLAISRLRRLSAAKGVDGISPVEIDEEIAKVRQERRQ